MFENETFEDDHLALWLESVSNSSTSPDTPHGDNGATLAQRFRRARNCLEIVQRVWSDETEPVHDTDSEPVAHTSDAAHLIMGRFHVLCEIGRGGHGVVYLADDPVLRRQVALKVPRNDSLSSRGWRERFAREAQAIASLSHPNIVQVYDAGVDSASCWIASSFCRGRSLAEWLKRSGESPSPRDAARLCAVLAKAVHFVHQQGILHRDLKPSNVLFEPQRGETAAGDLFSLSDVTPKISDFGLAKFFESQEDRTATGAILGTPAYMAPEQAEGRHGDVGPATDLYAIGAILYELLVDKPPFLGRTDLDTLRELTSRQPTPPRKLRSTIPRDLDAICLKCLEFQPRQRYASGDDLAADLDNYLSGLPVQARPVRAISRLIKWGRRKPLVAGLTIALGLAIVAGLTLVTWQWQHTRLHYRRAQQNFQQAHQAVQEMHSLVYKDDEYDAPEFHPLRKGVVTLALKYYEQFQTQEIADAALIADIASAYRDIGFIAHGSGSQTEALRLYGKSLGLWEQLTRMQPDHRKNWYFLASVQTLIAQVHVDNHRLDEAIPLLEDALNVHKRMGHRETDPGAVAHTLGILVEVYQRDGRETEALEIAQEAVTLRESLASAEPLNVHLRREMAGSYVTLGSVYLHFEHPNEAIRWCERARSVQEELASRDPEVPYAAGNLAHTLGILGKAQTNVGQNSEALVNHRKACQILTRISRQYPSNLGYQRKLARAYMNLGNLQRESGETEEAIVSHAMSRDILQTLVKADSESNNLRFQLAHAYAGLGRDHLAADRPADGLALLETACDVCQVLLDEQPGNHAFQNWLTRVNRDIDKAASPP